MMYTPTPAARRPKPPGVIHRRGNSITTMRQQQTSMALSTADSSGTLMTPDTGEPRADSLSQRPPLPSVPFSLASSASPASSVVLDTPAPFVQREARKQEWRSGLSRISASPQSQEERDVSIALDNDRDVETKRDVAVAAAPVLPPGDKGPMGNLITGTTAQPSPPPPYGQMGSLLATTSVPFKADAATPPEQDPNTVCRPDSSITSASADALYSERPASLEERQRVRRAADAARSVGLELYLGGSDSLGGGEISSEDGLSDGEMAQRFKELKRQLRARDTELLMTAEVADRVLRHHEQVISSLPPQVQARIPHLSQFRDNPSTFSNAGESSSSGSFRLSAMGMSSSTSSSALSPIQTPYSVSMPAFAMSPSASSFMRSPQVYQYPSYPSIPVELASPFPLGTDTNTSGSHRPFRTIRTSDTNLPFPMHHHHRPGGLRTSVIPSTHSTQQTRYNSLQQQDAEDRLVAMEQALSDSKESEDAQRRLAARLKRELDKLQRELERSEERMAESVAFDGRTSLTTSRRGVSDQWRKRENTVDKDLRASYNRAVSNQGPLAEEEENDRETRNARSARETSFASSVPEAGPSRLRGLPERRGLMYREIDEAEALDEVLDKLSRLGVGSIRSPPLAKTNSMKVAGRNISSSQSRSRSSSIRTRPIDDITSRSASSSEGDGDGAGGATLQRARTVTRQAVHRLALPEGKKLRKKVSKTSFLSPAKSLRRAASPLSPRRTVEAPRPKSSSPMRSSSGTSQPRTQSARTSSLASASGSGSGSVSMKRSPYPSPRVSLCPASPAQSQSSRVSGLRSLAASPAAAFNSLSSKMASMRLFVSEHLGNEGNNQHRTLGSELGSEFGDDWDKEMRSLGEVAQDPRTRYAASEHGSSDDEMGDISRIIPQAPGGTDGEAGVDVDEEAVDNEVLVDSNDGLGGLLSDSVDEGEDGDGDDGHDQSPEPLPHRLPPRVSAALSSLAIALAPPSIFTTADSSVPILPRGSLREPGLDPRAYELLSEAVKMRRIKWADTLRRTPRRRQGHQGQDIKQKSKVTYHPPPRPTLGARMSQFALNEKNWSAPDPWEEGTYPDELSDGSTGVRPSRSYSHHWQQSQSTQYQLRPLMLGRGVRPALHARTSSDGTVALAHRRILLGPPSGPSSSSSSTSLVVDPGTGEGAPKTIPARVLNDILVIMAIAGDWMEFMVIILYRVIMEARYGQTSTRLGFRERGQKKRYYI